MKIKTKLLKYAVVKNMDRNSVTMTKGILVFVRSAKAIRPIKIALRLDCLKLELMTVH
jgi:hypothetical protein